MRVVEVLPSAAGTCRRSRRAPRRAACWSTGGGRRRRDEGEGRRKLTGSWQEAGVLAVAGGSVMRRAVGSCHGLMALGFDGIP